MDIQKDIDNYLRTLKGVGYRSLYNFATQQSEAFTEGYKLAENRLYSEKDVIKAIELARDIYDGKDSFTANDITGCTEVDTIGWRCKFSDNEIIEKLKKYLVDKI